MWVEHETGLEVAGVFEASTRRRSYCSLMSDDGKSVQDVTLNHCVGHS